MQPVALGVNQYGGIPTRNVRETFERALDLATDVMVLAGLDWSVMPLSVRTRIRPLKSAASPAEAMTR